MRKAKRATLTDEQLVKYLQQRGSICPLCGSTDLEAGECVVAAGCANQAIQCCKCHYGWHDFYRLAGIVDEQTVRQPDPLLFGEVCPECRADLFTEENGNRINRRVYDGDYQCGNCGGTWMEIASQSLFRLDGRQRTSGNTVHDSTAPAGEHDPQPGAVKSLPHCSTATVHKQMEMRTQNAPPRPGRTKRDNAANRLLLWGVLSLMLAVVCGGIAVVMGIRSAFGEHGKIGWNLIFTGGWVFMLGVVVWSIFLWAVAALETLGRIEDQMPGSQ
ncbi:MAG: hypothetical protein ACYDBB_17685 [Armatimonadota bacterium]